MILPPPQFILNLVTDGNLVWHIVLESMGYFLHCQQINFVYALTTGSTDYLLCCADVRVHVRPWTNVLWCWWCWWPVNRCPWCLVCHHLFFLFWMVLRAGLLHTNQHNHIKLMINVFVRGVVWSFFFLQRLGSMDKSWC